MYARCFSGSGSRTDAGSHVKILLTGTEELHSGKGSGFVVGYDHVSYEDGLRSVFGDNLICNPDYECSGSSDKHVCQT